MSIHEFRAMIVEEDPEKGYIRRIGQKTISDLPEGDVLIKVLYSSLNYKDALSCIGNKGVTRHYPHTPGIDAAGEVVQSDHSDFRAGDKVLVTGYDLGMNTAGGFAQYIRVPAQWVVPLPDGLTHKECMTFGTAGFTAALCLHKLQQAGVRSDHGTILVTGATGGVGSLAVALLAHAGYTIAAATGKAEASEYLKSLGAAEILPREQIMDTSDRALLAQRWAGVIDTVGGPMLSSVLRATRQHGAVACCGNVASPQLQMTVYPFILRGISLLGADSASSEMPIRRTIWRRLASEWKIDTLNRIGSVIGLDKLDNEINLILAGKMTGRRIIDISL
jgi:acrylyl-CoA reductase (NADPH)